MAPVVAVVTDSTACLSADLAAGVGVRIVGLRVVLGGRAADEDLAGSAPGGASGADRDQPAAVTVAQVEAVLRAGGRVGTASPAPERFAAAYAAAAAAGAEFIVSVHLSARLSGTLNSARLAAARAPVPVRVVDSRSIGMGLGIAVLTAAAAARAGADIGAVAAAAASRAARLRSIFALDTPGYLQAGGRLEPSPALPASGLTARPLLHIRDGRIAALEKARTLAGAIARLEQLAAEFAADQPVDLAVQYAGEASRGAALAGRLAGRIPGVRRTYLAAAGPVICAHTGPGMLGVVVAPH
jgi:DegV family protein with EDD domain